MSDTGYWHAWILTRTQSFTFGKKASEMRFFGNDIIIHHSVFSN